MTNYCMTNERNLGGKASKTLAQSRAEQPLAKSRLKYIIFGAIEGGADENSKAFKGSDVRFAVFTHVMHFCRRKVEIGRRNRLRNA